MGGAFDQSPEMLAGAEAAFASFLARRQRGEVVDFEAFCADRSHLEANLRVLHEAWQTRSSAPEGRVESIRQFLTKRLGPDAAGVSLDGHEPRAADSSVQQRLRQLANRSGRYTLRGEVARGGMGVILRVWDRDLRRTLAMKASFSSVEGLVDGDPPSIEVEQASRFFEEAQITGQLEHPGVVPVHELGVDDEGRMFFTMQLVRGQTLDDIFKLARAEESGWNRVRALGILVRVCEAMAYAHSKGVIHRDLKPANVMVGKFGEVYVMDWGLAKVIGRRDLHADELAPGQSALQSIVRTDRIEMQREPDSPLATMAGTIIGTPAFMPPEQAEGRIDELDPRSDIYSVGALLYSLATGWMPYVDPANPSNAGQVLQDLMHGPPKPVSDIDSNVPVELVAICEKAMARRPADRYQDVLEMAYDMRAFLEGRVVKAHRTGAVVEFKKWVERNKPMAVAVAAIVLLALGSAIFVAWQERKQNRNLQAANERTDFARSRAVANAQQAHANAAIASENARRAERQSYLASLAAAHASLRMHETAEAKLLLNACPEEFRGWEWRHLLLRADTSLATLRGHGAKVTAAAISPDGTRVASGSEDGMVRVWNRATGEELFTLPGVAEAVTAIAFSPDGTRLVAAAKDMLVHVWDPQAARLLGTLAGHESAVGCVAFSPDGAFVVSGADEGLRVWDVRGLRPLLAVPSDEAIHSVAFAATPLVAAAVDSGVLLVRPEEGAAPRLLERSTPVSCVAFDASGERLAAGARDGTLALLDVASGKSVATLIGHIDPLTAVVFTRDGKRLLSASYDKTVRIWETEHGQVIDVLQGHDAAVLAVSCDAAGENVVTGSADETVRLWTTAGGGAIRSLHADEIGLSAVAFAPGVGVLAAAGMSGVHMWSVATGRFLRAFAEDGAVTSVAFGPAGDRLVVGGEDDATARVIATDTGEVLHSLDGHEASVTAVAVTADGVRIATGSADRSARVYEAASGKLLRVLLGHEQRISAVAFSVDGARLVTTSFDGTARLWNALTGAEEHVLRGHEGAVLGAVFDPRGGSVVTVGADGKVRFWDVASGAPGRVLVGHAGAVGAIAFDREGSRLVTGGHDKTVRVWDPATGDLLLRMRAHDGWVTGVAFGPAGIASCSFDASVKLWRTAR